MARERSFANINLKVKAGEVLAVVGFERRGKSTP